MTGYLSEKVMSDWAYGLVFDGGSRYIAIIVIEQEEACSLYSGLAKDLAPHLRIIPSHLIGQSSVKAVARAGNETSYLFRCWAGPPRRL